MEEEIDGGVYVGRQMDRNGDGSHCLRAEITGNAYLNNIPAGNGSRRSLRAKHRESSKDMKRISVP